MVILSDQEPVVDGMRPRIYSAATTDFSVIGYGTLDCVSCIVTEELRGIYELEMKIHCDSRHFDRIAEGNIILATHSNKGDMQPFQIYKVRRLINGFAEVYAEHVSYRLNKSVVMPYSANGIQDAVSKIRQSAAEDCGFSFTTDMTSDAAFKLETPRTIKSLLYGETGSIVDVYEGGELEYDHFMVRIWKQRGEDNGVLVRYGKNLTDIKKETDISDIYTAIVPYWRGTYQEAEVTLTLNEKTVESDYVDQFPTRRTVAVDFSTDFDELPTQAQLRSAAKSYVNNNVRRQLMTSIETSFIDLSITDEYKNKSGLMSVNLGDYVTVVHEALGIEDKQEVVKVVYDVLLDRNKSVELGDLKKTLASALRSRDTGVRSLINNRSDATKRELENKINTSNENCQKEIDKVREDLQEEIDKLKQADPTDKIHPVGSIYLTVGTENPGTIFGGTWKMIETGRYLRSAAVGGAEQTGGSVEHQHEYKFITHTNLGITATNANGESIVKYPAVSNIIPLNLQDVTESKGMTKGYLEFNASQVTMTKDSTVNTQQEFTAKTLPERTEPPYFNVYMWQRIS